MTSNKWVQYEENYFIFNIGVGRWCGILFLATGAGGISASGCYYDSRSTVDD